MTEYWPSWRYGPNGQSAIFNHAEEVPEGWEDHPSKVKNGAHPEMHPGYDEPQEGVAAPPSRSAALNDEDEDEPEQKETVVRPQSEALVTHTDKSFVLPPAGKITKKEIVAQLTAKKVPHNPNWKHEKLYDLLRDHLTPKGQ